MKHMVKFTALVCCSLAAASLFAVPKTGWLRTAGGKYVYDDPTNWVNGEVNGFFGSDLTLDGAQTITFTNDLTLAQGLSIHYDGAYGMTFQSAAKDENDAPRPITLTLGGDIVVDTVKDNGSIIIKVGAGSTDPASNGVTINLGGVSRTVSVTKSKVALQILNKVTNGGLVLENTGSVRLDGTTNDYGLGTTFRGTGTVNVMNDALGTGNITVENAVLATGSSDCTFTRNNKLILDGTLKFSSSKKKLDLGSGDIFINRPVTIEASNGTLILGGQVAADSLYGLESVTKAGGETLQTVADVVSDKDVTLTATQGTWLFDGAVRTTGKLAVSGGWNYGSGGIRLSSANNSFAGPVVIEGRENAVSLVFTAEGSLPDGVTFLLKDNGVLQGSAQYSCSYFLENHLIDTASTGILGVGVDKSEETIDLSDYPNLYLGSSGGNLTFNGKIIAGESGYRLGGPKYLYIAGVNALTGKHDVFIKNSSVFVANGNDVEGTVYVPNGEALTLQNSNSGVGALSNCDIIVGRYSKLVFNANIGSGEMVRVKSVTLKGGYLDVQGNTGAETNQKVSENVIVSEVLGGYSMIRMKTNNKYDTILTCNTIDLSGPAVVGIEGFNLGGAPGANSCHIKATSRPTLVGGNGLAGSTTISIVPQMIGGTTENGAEAGGYVQSFVTYDDTVGYRPLDLTTEYVQGLPTDGTQHNVRLLATETRELAGSLTVNALLLQSVDAASGLVDTLKLAENAPDGTKLTITSGQIISGQRKQNTTIISAPIDFGSAHGMIAYGSYNFSDFRSSVSGDNGLTLVQSIPKPSNSRYVNFRTPSTFSGDVYVLNDVGFENGFLPNGNERPGVLHLSYLTNCAHPTMSANALDGDGKIMANNSGGAYLTVGASGEEGDYQGLIDGKYGIIKLGSGRQRLAGNCSHYQSTTVSEGTLQVDGAFTQSAVTVADGATLAGCGTFGKSVTLAAGAKLEAGSKKVEDQVMNLDAGLTVAGDATLDLVFKDNLTVGGITLGGALTVHEGKITVNVALGAGEKLKSKQHVIVESTEQLDIAKFKRGENCGNLKLSADGTQLLMTVQSGLALYIR